VTPNSGGRASAVQPYAPRADASAAARSATLSPVPEDIEKLALAPGFLIGLNVLDEPDLAGSYRVDQDGNVILPVLGTLHVAGLTGTQANALIRQKLIDDGELKNPQVTLNMLEYTVPQVTILGEVVSPGKYPLLTGHSLEDVLALAGGPNSLAGNEVEITRASARNVAPTTVHYSRETNLIAASEATVNPGDLVRVKRAGIVYVMGAVMRPGGYVMQEDGTLNVMQAISLASGTTPSANTGTLHILRPNDDGSVLDIPLSYSRLMHGKTAPIVLQAKDVVYVPTSKFKAVFTNSSALLSSVASATIYTLR